MPENTFNEQQYEWYELDDQGDRRASGGGGNQTPKWIKWVAGGVLLLLVVILAIFLVRTIFDDDGLTRQDELERQAMEDSCNDAKDKEQCLRGIAARLAQQNGNSLFCNDLEGEEKDGCLYLAARSSLDDGICKSIAAMETRNSCHDYVYSKTLGDDRTFADCKGYKSDDRRVSCEAAERIAAVIAGECDVEGITTEDCLAGGVIERAKAARNPDICDEIADENWMHACIERVGDPDLDLDGVPLATEISFGSSDDLTDSDNDGLGDYEEIFIYNSDPSNPDTDGDGFMDGVEVESGFAPTR